MSNRYVLGQPNAICDICGFRFPLSSLHKNWRGLMVCRSDYEARNAQEFVRGRTDRMLKPNMRPEPEDVFIEPNDVTVNDL